MPGLPVGNYYASLGNKYAYFYAAHCVNENPAFDSEMWGVPQKLNMWYIFYEKFHSDPSL